MTDPVEYLLKEVTGLTDPETNALRGALNMEIDGRAIPVMVGREKVPAVLLAEAGTVTIHMWREAGKELSATSFDTPTRARVTEVKSFRGNSQGGGEFLSSGLIAKHRSFPGWRIEITEPDPEAAALFRSWGDAGDAT